MAIDNYTLRVDYDKKDNIPSGVLMAAAKSVEAFEQSDRKSLEKIGMEASFKTFLDGVEEGSLKINLRIEFSMSWTKDDTDNVYSNYFYECRLGIIDVIRRNKLVTREILLKCVDSLNNFALKTNANFIQAYKTFRIEEIADSIELIQSATSALSSKERVSLISRGKGAIEIPKAIVLPPMLRDQLLVKSVERYPDNGIVLLVKKPDYLGSSMWDFIYNNKRISAKITYLDFVMKFQNRVPGYEVQPGDSIVADIMVISQIGFDGESIKSTYEVTYVKRVSPDPGRGQTRM